MLLHLVDVYNDDAGDAYATIRRELEKYSDLATRPEVVALTKCEGVDPEIVEMQMATILAKNPEAQVLAISSSAHQGLDTLLRELKDKVENKKEIIKEVETKEELPTIKLNDDLLRDTWKVEKVDDKFVVTGEKIEKFARRTDLNNYASVNRLRDIMKKFGIRGELTSMGAQPDSVISIAGKEFTLVEDYD